MSFFQDPFIIIKAQDSPDYSNGQKKRDSRQINVSTWNLEEKKQYLRFFKQNMENTSLKEQKKFTRMFLLMTKYITTRTPKQIKSHHQKLMLKHKTLKAVLQSLEKEFSLLEKDEKQCQMETGSENKEQIEEFYLRKAEFIENEVDTTRSNLGRGSFFSQDFLFDILIRDDSNSLMQHLL